MSLFEWSDRLLTGDDIIDFQHQKLFELANKLVESINNSGEARLFVEVLLDQLLDYTDYHFSDEESLMQKLNYPGYESHKAMHDKLRSQVHDFREEFRQGKAEVSQGLMQILNDWLFNHIQKVDTQLADFVPRQ